MAGAAGDVPSDGLGDVAVLQRQGIGRGMGIHRTMAPRLRWEGNHQLNGIPLRVGSGLRPRTGPHPLRSAGPRQTRRHHRRTQRQIQLAHCRSAASGGSQVPGDGDRHRSAAEHHRLRRGAVAPAPPELGLDPEHPLAEGIHLVIHPASG